ncbi:MAG: toxin [Thermodesulfobacteriota bacterium]|nr:toxin [Thermodesulfobacteriota bacterium]
MVMFKWNPEKNRQLIKERGISFDEVIQAIADGYAANDVPHWNKKKYPNQRILTVVIRNYAYLVPYVIDGENYFLKTIIPSRKEQKRLRGEEND